MPFVDTFVIVEQNSGYVDSVRAWHTILAIITRYGRVLHHEVGRVEKKPEFFFR